MYRCTDPQCVHSHVVSTFSGKLSVRANHAVSHLLSKHRNDPHIYKHVYTMLGCMASPICKVANESLLICHQARLMSLSVAKAYLLNSCKHCSLSCIGEGHNSSPCQPQMYLHSGGVAAAAASAVGRTECQAGAISSSPRCTSRHVRAVCCSPGRSCRTHSRRSACCGRHCCNHMTTSRCRRRRKCRCRCSWLGRRCVGSCCRVVMVSCRSGCQQQRGNGRGTGA